KRATPLKREASAQAGESVPRMGLLHRRKPLGAGLALILRFPGLVGHAVDSLAAVVLAHGHALRVGRLLEPIGKAVAAETGEVHQVVVLQVGPFAKMPDKAPEGGGFELGSVFVVDGHDCCPAVAELCYDVGLVTDFAISYRKQRFMK